MAFFILLGVAAIPGIALGYVLRFVVKNKVLSVFDKTVM